MGNISTSTITYATYQPTGTLVFLASDGTACVLWSDGTNQVFSYAQSPYTSWTKQTLVTGVRMELAGAFRAGTNNIDVVTGPSTSNMYPNYYPLTYDAVNHAWTKGTANQMTSAFAMGTTGTGAAMHYAGQDPYGRHWIFGGGPSTYITRHHIYSPANTPTNTAWTASINQAQAAHQFGPAGELIGNYAFELPFIGTAFQWHRLDVSGASLGSWSGLVNIPNVTGTPNGSSRVNFKEISTAKGAFVYSTGSGVYAQIYTVSGDSWSAATQLSSNANDRHPIVVGDGTGNAWAIWCSYVGSNNFALVYKKYNGSTWDTNPTTLVASGSNITNPNGGYGNNTIGVTYMVGTASPYTIGFATFATIATYTATRRGIGRIKTVGLNIDRGMARARVGLRSVSRGMARARILLGGIRRGIGRMSVYSPTVHSDDFNRTSASNLGTASDGHSYTYTNVANWSVNGSNGQTTNTTVWHTAQHGTDDTFTDGEITWDWKLDQAGTGCGITVMARGPAAANCYRLGYQSGRVRIYNVVAGVTTDIGTNVLMGITANTWYSARARLEGNVLSLKMWLKTDTEPADWQMQVTDNTYSSGILGIAPYAGTAARVQSFDNWTVTALTTAELTATKRFTGRVAVGLQALQRGSGRARISIQKLRRGVGRMSIISPLTAIRRGIARIKLGLQTIRRGSSRATVYTHQDTFYRANGALGTASDGDVENTSGAGGWAILNNAAVCTGTAGITNIRHAGADVRDIDQYVTYQTTASGTTAGLFARGDATTSWVNNCYRLRIRDNTTMDIARQIGGVGTVIATKSFTHLPNTNYTIRFKVAGLELWGKIWLTGSPEPDAWDLHATDSYFMRAGSFGIQCNPSATTNTMTFTNYYAGDAKAISLRGTGRMSITAIAVLTALRRGSARIRLLGSVSRRSTARAIVWIQQKRRGTGRIRLGLKAFKRGSARIKLGLRTLRRGTARMRLGLRRTFRGMARAILRVQVLRRGMARIKLQGRIYRRGIARIRIQGRSYLRGKARLNVGLRNSERGSARIKIGLKALRRGLARMSIVAGVLTGKWRGKARIFLQARITKRGLARIKLGVQHLSKGVARIRIVANVSRRGRARAILWIQTYKRGRARLTLWVRKQLRAQARIWIVLQQKRRGMARLQLRATGLRRGMARIALRLNVLTAIRKGKGRIKTVRLALQRSTARMAVGLRKLRRGMARVKLVLQNRKRGSARVRIGLQAKRRSVGRVLLVRKLLRRGSARVRIIGMVLRRGTARAQLLALSTRYSVARLSIQASKKRKAKARLLVAIQAHKNAMAYMKVILLNTTFFRAHGRMFLQAHGTHRSTARMLIVECTGYSINWEKPETTTIWAVESTIVEWEVPETEIAWDIPDITPEWRIPETGVVWKRR